MISDPSTLPDDPVELKKIIAQLSAEHASQYQQLESRHQRVTSQYQQEIDLLLEQMRTLYDHLFGRKSEKYFGTSPQLLLFDMPEGDPEPELAEHLDIPAHARSKPGRKVLPEHLPRVEVLHDIADEEKQCGCGAELSRIGEEVSEKLDLIPAIIRVIRHIRPKYSCRVCEGVEDEGATVKIAPLPEQIIPKGIASGGLLAHIITAKFCDGLPFYRQEKQFTRLGVELNRNTMCNWSMKVATACEPLLEMLCQEIRSGPLINIDETTVQVLAEPGRAPTSKSYMWVFRGGDPGKPSLVYQYHPSRSGSVASSFLGSYQGAVMSDGYVGYEFLATLNGVTHLGCWAHVRRKFVEAQKGGGARSKKAGSSDVALALIRKLYAIEKRGKAQNLEESELVELRRKEALPVLAKLRGWLEKKSLHVVPKSLLGKAVSYTLSQWVNLVGYVDCAAATLDNNLAENAIRPFVVGRKNWLFSGTPEGAQASAALYSLVETAKASGLDVYQYLRYLFEKLPFAKTENDYRKLLPQLLKAEDLVLPNGYSVV